MTDTRGQSSGLLDPLAFSANLTQGRSRTELSDATSDASTLNLSYNLLLQRHGPKLPFGGIEVAAVGSPRRPLVAIGIQFFGTKM